MATIEFTLGSYLYFSTYRWDAISRSLYNGVVLPEALGCQCNNTKFVKIVFYIVSRSRIAAFMDWLTCMKRFLFLLNFSRSLMATNWKFLVFQLGARWFCLFQDDYFYVQNIPYA